MQSKIQMWFMGLPLPVKGVILAVVLIPTILMVGFEVPISVLVGALPWVGGLFCVGAVGGFAGWRSWQQKQAEEQDALNRQLAAKGLRCLVLPPQGDGSSNSWRRLRTQADNFMVFLSSALRQFPDQHVALEIIGDETGTVLQVWAPMDMFQTVRQGLNSSFPNSQIREPKDVIKKEDMLAGLSPQTQWVTLKLSENAGFPLRESDQFDIDSLGHVLAALHRSPGMGRLGFQAIFTAPYGRWDRKAQQDLQRLRQGLAEQRGVMRASGDKQRLRALEAKADAQTGMAVTVRVFAEPVSQARLQQVRMALVNSTHSRYNSLTDGEQGQGAEPVVGRFADYALGKETVLSATEASPLWHTPASQGGDLMRAKGIFIPPPASVTTINKPPFHPDWRILGQGYMRDGTKVFVKWPRGEDDFDANVHLAIVGATGSGKSTLMANLVVQDALGGRCGDIVIEPHRNLTLDIIQMVPPERLKDITWVNPTGKTRTFGLNPLDYGGDPRLRMAVGDSFVAALEKIIGGDWDAAIRMRRILNNTVQAILEGFDHPTMLHLMAFLRREEYREEVINKVTNPEVKDFWIEEFAETGGRTQQDMLGPVFTRLSPMLLKPMMRQVIGQQRTTLPMRQMMDAGEIILIDVSANNPEVGADNASALGTLLVNTIWGAAGSRVKGHYPIATSLWIDEFHRFVTRDIEKMLAEARGFGLGVYMATQYWSQLPPWMQDAIMNNTWTKMIGRVNGPREARLVSSMFNNVTKDQVLTLGSYMYLAQVSANKTPTQPFTLKTLLPLPPAKMRKAYHVQNHGALQHPSDNGATPYDFFQGISEMGHGDRKAWEDFQDRMPAAGVNQRAEFLAELSEDDFSHYKKLQRQRDLEMFHALLDNPDRDPEFVELTREERESLDDTGIKRVKRVRALSSLKVEVPREIVLAEDIRLRNEMDDSADVFDELLL